MPLLYVKGDLLASKDDALVNAVNTVGVMAKGIALRFKETFPANFRAYRDACSRNEVRVGKLFITRTDGCEPRLIVNFPTKEHWRRASKLEWISAGLGDLCRVIQEREIRSISLPALGCGNGGLNWTEVRALLQHSLGNIENVDIHVYEPRNEDRRRRPSPK